jgi:hypothetical protein
LQVTASYDGIVLNHQLVEHASVDTSTERTQNNQISADVNHDQHAPGARAYRRFPIGVSVTDGH